MLNSKSMNAVEFIDNEEILATLEWAKENAKNKRNVKEILEKAAKFIGLNHKEMATLLFVEDKDMEKQMFEEARKVKEHIYGKRIVLFAPLYLSNYCVNECAYCGYCHSNSHIARKQLTQEEIKREVIALQDMGHKRLALETGEDPVNCPIEYVLESIKTIYGIHHKNGAIRRVNVNIAATTVENYRKLHEAGIGTYILFQETYHKETYEKLHAKGPKHDYAYHTEAFDRAMQGGIDDVGSGVLFGLYDYKYDAVGLMLHVKHLEETFGVGPHTISVPRLRPACDVDLEKYPHMVSDHDFKKLVAILRLAVPYTGIILSTRENSEMRRELLKYGISQISGGSCTGVGGYADRACNCEKEDTSQFKVNDDRCLDEIINELCETGYIPSFCTACYREGRTGDRFMQLAKTGQIGNVCQANALITLNEYLADYASSVTKAAGEEATKEQLELIKSDKVRELTKGYIEKIKEGQRDFRF